MLEVKEETAVVILKIAYSNVMEQWKKATDKNEKQGREIYAAALNRAIAKLEGRDEDNQPGEELEHE